MTSLPHGGASSRIFGLSSIMGTCTGSLLGLDLDLVALACLLVVILSKFTTNDSLLAAMFFLIRVK